MNVGIVQPVVGHIGGNDKVLDSLFKVFRNEQITLFTFSDTSKTFPDNVKVVVKIPFHIPFLGIYQKLLMTQHDYSNCDVVISATGYKVKTDKPLIIYDQNNMANDFDSTVPKKYQSGLWKIYYLPYRFLFRQKKIPNAKYITNSRYSHDSLLNRVNIESDIIYPCVDTDEFYSLEKKRQVCVIGRISPEKNLENTVHILNQVDYPCFIFGNVTEPNKKYLQKLRSIANNNITFIINRPRSELLRLMASSKIIFTSSMETFGITTIEGIASNCIPIVPDNSAHKEVVPIIGLRYLFDSEASNMITDFMESDIPLTMKKLQLHIKKFKYENFERNFLNTVKSLVV